MQQLSSADLSGDVSVVKTEVGKTVDGDHEEETS